MLLNPLFPRVVEVRAMGGASPLSPTDFLVANHHSRPGDVVVVVVVVVEMAVLFLPAPMFKALSFALWSDFGRESRVSPCFSRLFGLRAAPRGLILGTRSPWTRNRCPVVCLCWCCCNLTHAELGTEKLSIRFLSQKLVGFPLHDASWPVRAVPLFE